MEKKSKKAFKIIMLLLVVAIIAAIICYLFPVIKNLSTQEGQVAFKEKVSNSGILGFLMLFGLQFAQIFICNTRRTNRNIIWNLLWTSMGDYIYYDFCCNYFFTYIFTCTQIWKKVYIWFLWRRENK